MKELERRIHIFNNKFASYRNKECSKILQEKLEAQRNRTYFSGVKERALETRLFRERFYGYDSDLKDCNGETFHKGIFGIAKDYYSTHPEELTDEAIQNLIDMLNQDVLMCINLVDPEEIQNRRTHQFTEQEMKTIIFRKKQALESDWSTYIVDLVQELKMQREKYFFEKRTQNISTVMNNNTVTNGIIITGNSNNVNAQYGEQVIKDNQLKGKINESDNLTPAEEQIENIVLGAVEDQLNLL
jgi:hypothetical protein